MNNLYTDESGSMTVLHSDIQPYFVISMVHVLERDRLKRIYKRFVASHLNELKALDKEGKMFKDDKFRELKGNEFSPELKKEFINYFCQNHLFELFYVAVYNKEVANSFYTNTARAFNYLVKLSLTHFIHTGHMDNTGFALQMDERNERTGTKRFLQDYLNTELFLSGITNHESTVEYFDSADNHLIQVADVFANIFYSDMMTNNYQEDLKTMNVNGYIKKVFVFPPDVKRSKSRVRLQGE